MSTEDKTDTTLVLDNKKLDEWNEKFFKIDRRMARKIQFETKKQLEKVGARTPELPSTPLPKGPAPYPSTKDFDGNIAIIKKLPVEERAGEYHEELVTLQNLGQNLIADKNLDSEKKKLIAAEIKAAKEKINAELAADVIEIKNLKVARKKTVTDQLDAIKVTMSQVEKLPSDKGEVSQAIMAYQTAKANLLKALTQDMTEAVFQTADAAVKQLKKAVENALAVDQAKRDRVAASQKTLNTLGPTLAPDETGSFPAGTTKAIDKATDRTIVGHGPLFKPVLKALGEVEKAAVEPQLTVLETAAKAYLADYDRRVAEGQASGKAFNPDKITTKKADTCRDAIEKVRRLRVTRNIQDELAKLPKNPRTPDEEAGVNRLKAKMLVESGGSKQLDPDQSGASESFFLTDPTTKEKAFIFKPSDGEFDAGYGWKKGGGAPREVVLSSVNDALKNSIGLDCGVSTTTLVKVNSPSVATDRNGKNPERVGAVQNFVKSDPTLSKKLDQNKPEYDKNFINQVPPEEIEKVALLDFVTLQMDRQPSNLLVQPDPNGAPRLTPIDAGNAMPSRKAFEASRRMFTNNAVLGGDEAKKPFSAEALKKIEDLDESAIADAMRKANAEMAKIDPQAGTAVEDETIEMTRRSILFLKMAAKQLTKAEIADAYAYQFHNVIDAKPKDVDKAIAEAIKATLAKPAQIDAIDKFPNAQTTFTALGWPPGEFTSFKSENPVRLLDILQKGTQCAAALAEIQEIIKEVGLKNFETDPNTIPDIGKRRLECSNAREKAREAKALADPELEKKMKKSGAEFVIVNAKTGAKQPMTSESTKGKLAIKVNAYFEAGGDDELKRRGKSPSKMTFEQKYFESLGGDELIQELKRKNLNPYDGDNIAYKSGDLEDYKQFVALGGEEEYVRLGCPQNKEITLDNRVKMMRQKLALE